MSVSSHDDGSPQIETPQLVAANQNPPVDDSFEVTSATLRLLVGGLLVSATELQRRLQGWESSAADSRTANDQTRMTWSESVTDAPSVRLRHALVGMLFDAESRVRKRISSSIDLYTNLFYEADYAFSTRFEPAIRQTPLYPILDRLNEAAFTFMVMMDRWSARGRLEERQSRIIAQSAFTDVVDDLLDYMSHNPKVRELIEQQGIGVAEEAMDEVRSRTAVADMQVERLAHSLFRRPLREATRRSSKDATTYSTHDLRVSPSSGAGG